MSTIVSDEDYEFLRQWNWYALSSSKNGTLFYAATNWKKGLGKKYKTALMHKVIGQRMGLTGKIDHQDRDSLNNQRENLRRANSSQNGWNQGLRPNNTSGYKGVTFDASTGKWLARICYGQGQRMYLGAFASEVDAGKAYNEAAKRIHGEFAVLNEIPEEKDRQSVISDIAIDAAELSQLLRHGTVEDALANYVEMMEARTAADGRHREPIIVNPTSNHQEGDSKF